MSRLDGVAYLLLSLRGRISRSRFWLGTLILAIISFAATYLILAAVGISDQTVAAQHARRLRARLSLLCADGETFPGPRQAGWTALIAIVPVYAVNLLQTFRVIDPYAPTPLYHALNLAAIDIGVWILLELGFLKARKAQTAMAPIRWG